ncbi:MAG: endonuclease/exonuclease/phosphatase family protein [Bacteroidales bacterium]|nr:endonuclease/exonuclease/phosphatase family protein [Bacteroidales bacterium]MCF8333059.1 endonuclease/exonuclease/phosphatase family protein [Bacteroidales bacterium]
MIKKFLLILFAASAAIGFAQENTIFFDGITDDWNRHYEEIDDSRQDGGAIELLALKVTNDENNIYINFTLEEEMLLNSGNDLTLYLDTDQNSSTGYSVENLGAELSWKFGSRYGYYNESKERIYHNDIGFSALPTVASDEFEVMISRDAQPNGTDDLFEGANFNLLLKSDNGEDAIPNAGETFTYHIDDELTNTFNPIDISRPEQNHLRVMSYNILHDGIMKPAQQPHIESVLQAINPDVIVFNECWDTQATDVESFMDEALPLDNEEGWSAVKKDQGNIITTRYDISDSWHVHNDMRLTGALIDLPDKRFMHDFLITGAHFRCCDANEARQREADAFIEFVNEAKETGGRIELPEDTPIMLAGDLNLVGDSQQLETLLTGEIINTSTFGEGGAPDWDGTALKDVISYHSDNPYALTWMDNESSYWPGRLDFSIMTNSSSEVLKSFILETGNMSQQRLDMYGLVAEDTRKASDHLPKVTDISIRGNIGTPQEETTSLKVLPNPVRHILHIKTGEARVDSIRVFSASSGKLIFENENPDPEKETHSLDAKEWERGIYIVQLSLADSGKNIYKKVIVMN